jgi:nucleoid-associated protein YgaU
MGRVEKFTVLAVLLLIAIILVVSMTTDKPVDKSKAAVLGEKPSPAQSSNEVSAAGPGAPDSKLLSATVGTPIQAANTPPAAAAPQPLAIPNGSLLKTTAGLSEGFDSSRLLYTWQSNDSYVTVAKKLYGEPTKFTLIQNANEGREDIQPGEKILVPVFDVENVVAEAPLAGKPEAKPEAKPEVKKSTTAKTAPAPTGGRLHTVKKGESLWKIAQAELGNGGRWEEIYNLNKDKLKSPEALRDGMKLTLP